jgi:hypothetical protein
MESRAFFMHRKEETMAKDWNLEHRKKLRTASERIIEVFADAGLDGSDAVYVMDVVHYEIQAQAYRIPIVKAKMIPLREEKYPRSNRITPSGFEVPEATSLDKTMPVATDGRDKANESPHEVPPAAHQ